MYKFNCSECNINLKDFNKKTDNYYRCNCKDYSYSSVILYTNNIEIFINGKTLTKYFLYIENNTISSVTRVDYTINNNPIIRVTGRFNVIYENRKIDLPLDKDLNYLQIVDYFYSKFILNEIFI